MMLGKRSRHNSVKRTTSLLEFTFDPVDVHANPADQNGEAAGVTVDLLQQVDTQINTADPAVDLWTGTEVTCPRATGVVEGQVHHHHQMMHRRHSADFAQSLDMNMKDHIASHFLRDCSLCKRRLVPGRDIYMYRGDRAFCSSECRQQQISQDNRKEKSSTLPKKGNTATAVTISSPRPPSSPSSSPTAPAQSKDVFVIGGEMVTSTAPATTTATITMCN